MDLFAIASTNGPDIAARMATTTAALSVRERASLERFAARVLDEGRISINMRQSVLLSFLVSSRHQNIYEWAAARAAHSTKTAAEIMRDQLGGYYDSRMAFDGFFDDGDRFRYGALNIGGAGASHYGSYCGVVKDDVVCHRLDVTYLRADSLKTYLLPGPCVDGSAVQRDAAPHPYRHCLAAIKHAGELVAKAEPEWPAMVCNNHEYVEAIFRGELTAGDLECVRMTRADHEALYEFAFEEFKMKLDKADRMEVDNFVLILEELGKRGIPLEVV